MMIWVSVVFMMIFMQAVINCPKTVVLGKSVVTPGKDGTPVNKTLIKPEIKHFFQFGLIYDVGD